MRKQGRSVFLTYDQFQELWQKSRQHESQMKRVKNSESSTLTFNNRLDLTRQFKEQRNKISKNDFEQLPFDLGLPVSEAHVDGGESANGIQRFNKKWLVNNSLSTGLADNSEAKRNVSEGRVVQQPDRFETADRKKEGLSGKGELNGSGSIGGGRVIFGGKFGSLEEDSAGDDPFLEEQKMLSMEGDQNWNATRDNWTFKRNYVMLPARGKDTRQYGPFNC